MKNNKFICFLCLVAAALFMANIAYSSEYHKHTAINASTIPAPEKANGTALAIAMSQLSFDWSTKDYQAGVGLGNFNDQDAISIGFGKRVDRLLINGSVGRESNKYGYGFGVNWHF